MIKFYISQPLSEQNKNNTKTGYTRPGFFYMHLSEFMKRNYTFVLLVCFIFLTRNSYTQVSLTSDNFGTTAQNPISRTGWTANSASGSNWELRTTGASSGYTWSSPAFSASGTANVFTNLGTNNNTKTLTYDNSISTVGYNSIVIRFGGLKSGTVPTLDVAYDAGSGFVSAGTVTLNTSWTAHSVSLPAGAAGATNLKIRFSIVANSSSTNFIRLDDFQIIGTANVPAITLADNGTQVAAANVAEGTTNHILHKFQLAVTTANATLTGVACTTAGNYDAADITNLKVRYSGDATLDGADATLSTFTSPGAAGAKTFPSFTSQTISSGSTGYVFITADIDGAASGGSGNQININAITTGNLTFSAGSKSGSTTAGGTQTIITSGAPSVTIDNTGAPAAGNIVYNTNNVIIGGFRLTPSASVDFTALNVATSGTATTSDISNFELIYDADNSGTYNGSDAVVASISALANPLAFSGFTETFSSARRYLIIADVAAAATDGRTITTSIAAASDVSSTGNESGTATGNTQTIQAPEIRVDGNAIEIVDGDITPTTADHTGFGNVEVGQTLIRTFTIRNIGNQTLNLNASNPRVIVSAGSSQFVISTQPSAATISGPSGSLTFDVTFTPTAYTLQTATVSIVNNDANGSENPYTFDINGTGTYSNESVVSDNTDYASGTPEFNINTNYINFIDGTGSSTGKMIPMKLKIQDGGTDLTDNDNANTILTDIKFTVKDHLGANQLAQIKTAVLTTTGGTAFATATKVGSELVFSGMSGTNVTAVDIANGGSGERIFHLRVSFDETQVIDNTKLVFQVSSVSEGSGSGFPAADGGAAQTDNSNGNDRNRIEINADRIRFTTQPTDQTVAANLSTFTIRAVDIYNRVDLDASKTVSLTTSGTGMSSSSPYSLSNGVLNISDVQFSSAQGPITLTATTTGYTDNDDISQDFTISTIATGSYRTTSNCLWSSTSANNTGTWQVFSGGWQNLPYGGYTNTHPPTNTTTNKIYIFHTVTLQGNNTVKNIVIENGGVLNTSTVQPGFKNLLIKNGGVFNKNPGNGLIFDSDGILEVEDGGTFNYSHTNSTSRTTNLWNGTEKFHPNSNFVVKETDNTSPGNLVLETTTEVSLFNGACFGNFIIDMGSAGGQVPLFASGLNTKLTNGDFICRTGSNSGMIFNSGNYTVTIGGDLIIESTYTQPFTLTNSASTVNFTVNGNVIHNGTAEFRLANSQTTNNPSVTLNIDSNLVIGSSNFNFDIGSSSTGTNKSTVNLKGSLTTGTGNILTTNTNTAKRGEFNFSGTYNSSDTNTIQKIDVASTGASTENARVNFNVKSGAYTQLIARDFELGTNSKLTVETGGIFDFGFNSSTALNVAIASSMTGAAFESKQASTLKITSTDGLYGNWNTSVFPSVTQSTGNLRLSKSNRTIDNVATFWYIGKANQQTGDAPNANNSAGTYSSTANAKVVICDLASNALTLTPSISFGVTTGTTVDATYGGHLNIKKGQFRETTTAYIFGEGGTLRMEPGTYYYIPKGNVDLAAADADPIPRMSGLIHPQSQYYLNGGTIELAGTGASHAFQSLRGNTINPKRYINVTYSGANIYGTDFKNLTSEVVIDSALTITGDAIVKCHGGSATTPQSFTGNGGLVMSGTNSRLMIRKLNEIQPELVGDNVAYNLTGGTVEFYSTTATQQQLMRGNYTTLSNKPFINYYNIDINADEANWSTGGTFSQAGNVNMASGFRLTGTLNVNAPAVFRMDESDAITDGTGTSQVVNIKDYAGLLYGSPNGIKSSGTGSSDGNIRISGTRNFSSKASYGFIGNGDMVTGSGLPATTNGLYVYKFLSSNKVTLTNTVRADSILKMNSGHIITGASKFIELGTDISNLGTLSYTNGYIVGLMRRWYNGTNSGNASSLFPIGQDVSGSLRNRFYNIQYTSAPSAGGYLDVNFNPVAMGLAGLPITGIPAVGTCTSSFDATSTEDQGYWIATPQTGTLADGAYTLAITGEGFNTVNNLCELTLLKRVGTGNWTGPGNHLQPSGSAAVPTVSRSNISGFSNFGFGGGPANPLPVELISFNGVCMEDGISKISWSTASEFNSLNFIVQRSTDGVHYTNIAIVPSSGNSNQIRSYSVYDTSVNANSSYYRLVETDIYGTQTIYSFIQVKCGEVNGVHIFYAEPRVIAEINSTKDKMLNFSVYEVSGKLIHQESRQVLRGYNRLDLGIKNKLADGIYIIQMTDEDKISSSKIMVN